MSYRDVQRMSDKLINGGTENTSVLEIKNEPTDMCCETYQEQESINFIKTELDILDEQVYFQQEVVYQDEKCFDDIATCDATDPLLLSYKKTSNKSKDDLTSTFPVNKPAFTLIRLEGSMEKNPKQTCEPSRSKCPTIPAKPLLLVNKKSEDKRAVSCYTHKKVSRNGKMSVYEFRKTLESLMENHPIKYIRRRCCFPDCSSNDRNSKVFAFPRNLERTQDWLQRIGHSSSLEDANKFSHKKVLCEKHFGYDQFQSSKLRNKLKSISVPFFWSPIYSKDVALHRES